MSKRPQPAASDKATQISFRADRELHERLIRAARVLTSNDPSVPRMSIKQLITDAFNAYVKTQPTELRKKIDGGRA